jgi:hypothetical protein
MRMMFPLDIRSCLRAQKDEGGFWRKQPNLSWWMMNFYCIAQRAAYQATRQASIVDSEE